MRESSIAMSRRQHLTNDTESHRVRMRISTAEVASAKKQNVLFKKNTPPPPHTYVCISIIFSFSCNHCHTFEKQKTKVIESFFFGGGGWQTRCIMGDAQMANWRITKGGERLWATEYYGTRDARRESRRRRGVTFDSVLFYDRELTGTFSQAMFGQNESLEKLSITFTSNGKRDCVPREQVSALLIVYCSLFLHLN